MYDAQHNVLNSNIHVPASTLTGRTMLHGQ